MQALNDLLNDEGWTNSLEDLGVALKAVNDVDDSRLTTNVDLLLQRIVKKLLWCSDYKVADIGHRHELKFVIEKSYQGCSHKNTEEAVRHKYYKVTLQLEAPRGRKLCNVQAALDESMKTERSNTCTECNRAIVECVQRSIHPWSDPDFLTVYFSDPHSLQEKDLQLKLGQSSYAVKAVVHWDRERKKSGRKLERFFF